MCGGHKAVERVLLPKNVKPNGYKIHLTPDMKACVYKGVVTTELVVLSETADNTITFHSMELVIDFTQVQLERNGATVTATSHKINSDDEMTSVTFPGAPFAVGEILKLTVPFNNKLNDEMAGFYRSKYTVNGEERWIATTQFEPVDARRAFPCWDEPALKATFEITLTVPANLVALSNMPVADETKEGDLKTVHFQVTPKVSSYLVAFVIGEFDYVEGKTKHGVPMRVYTPLGQAAKGEFALDVGIKVLDFFTDYFNIPYPLPKLDHVAIPDFSAGAMENWGLVTYREAALLCDATSNVAYKNRVAYVVAHEEAHQWFGNICSPEWWKELWLNEGFATWAGTLAIDHVFPEWDVWTQFRSTYQAGALNLDSLLSSHPIEVDIARSRDITSIFDAISYHKGASVILMLADYIGPSFAKGLNVYLTRFSYGNAVTADLWKALSEVSGVDVAAYMHNWTSAVGFPVVSVKPTNNGHSLEVAQRRFLAGSIATAEQDTVTWDVRLAVQTDSQPKSFLTLQQKSQTFDYDTSKATWFKANAGQPGVLRVQYDSTLLEKLKTAVSKQSLGASDRIGIIGDAVTLSKAGLVPLSDVFSVLQSYADEDNYSVWQEVAATLGSISNILEGTEAAELFTAFKAKLWSKIAAKLGWDAKQGESDLTALLRSLALGALGNTGDEAVIAEARARFAKYLLDPNSLPSNLRDVVFRLVVSRGDAADREAMKKVYLAATAAEVKISSLFAVGSSRDKALIEETLEWGFHSGEVRSQDIHNVLGSCSQTAVGKIATFEAVKKNWTTIVERYGNAGFLGRSVVDYSSGGFVTLEKANEVEEFYKTHTMNAIERSVQQCLERIRSNAGWRTRELEQATAWLKAH
jgi:aminopeptidase N